MDKDTKNHSKNKRASILDTLAQVEKAPTIEACRGAKITLLKRARSKYISNNLALKLADLKTENYQSYFNTYHCAETLQQSGNRITGRYCNNRWCLTCNRIRTAKLIKGYDQVLSEMNDKRFVTLTVPNCSAETLQETIREMIGTFKKIQKTFIKRKTAVVGIRKLEVTFNPARNDYHPHFHIICSGEHISQELVNEWLKRYENASRGAQDDRAGDNNSVMELFKYFTKIVTKGSIHLKALDTIFNAMRGMRVFQPMGIKKNVTEEVTDITSEVYSDLESREANWDWIDSETDWIDKETGEFLTGYKPSANVTKVVNSTV